MPGEISFPFEGDLAPRNLVDLLRVRAKRQPEDLAFTFLHDGETDEVHLSMAALDWQARVIGGWLQERNAFGERVLLVYSPGLQFIAAFWGCLYAGAVAVPVYPPRLNDKLRRLQDVVTDSGATIVLTDPSTNAKVSPLLSQFAALRDLKWMVSDDLLSAAQRPGSVDLANTWQPPDLKSTTLAFLQYTSGSTGQPKGVMISHGNLFHNQKLIQAALMHPERGPVVAWLPLYHDMGLIGNVLGSLYSGGHCILMSPVAFIQRPVRWLAAITRYRAVTSGGPNLAYDLCVRKITAGQLPALDLSSWEVAFNGSEPVRAETLKRFADMFEPCGFRREVFLPCYGLAEGTLLVRSVVKHTPPVVRSFQTESLSRNQIVEAAASEENTRTLVSCGQSFADDQVIIVDPETRCECASDQVGEIWVHSDSVAQGYWNKPEETEQTFNARLAGCDAGSFLRTGDLGFIKEGGLFVAGRLKDLIIINGRNYHPQDIEQTVERTHPAIRAGSVVAFALEIAGEEKVVIAAEIERTYLRGLDPQSLEHDIREAVAVEHELESYVVMLLRPGSLPKTTSGKLRRSRCREMFLAHSFKAVKDTRDGLAPGTLSVAQLFESQVKQTPDATAVIIEERRLAYQQMEQRANQLAFRLQTLGVKPGSRVGVCLAPSPELLIGVLAVLKASGIFVPLVPSESPAGSISGLEFLITPTGPLAPTTFNSAQVVALDDLNLSAAEGDGENHPPRTEDEALGCLALNHDDGNESPPIILSHRDLEDYFKHLDESIGCRTQETLLTTLESPASLPIAEWLWVLTRGGRIVFSSTTEVHATSPQPSSSSVVPGIQFSLFYFSSNAAEFADDKYQLLIEGAKFADKHDFTAVWVPERHFHAFGGIYPNPSVLGSALAMITERIRIRAGSVVLPLHSPIRVAEEWSVVDNLSHGRVDLAFARGWNPNDFVLSPENYADSANILLTQLQTVRGLWRGESITVLNGVGKETEIKIHPLPRQRQLRFWITCSGGAERFADAGACGANVLTALLFQSVEELGEKIVAYKEARAKHGHDPATGHVTLMLHTFVGDNIDHVRRTVREPFLEYLKTSVSLWRHGSKNLDELTQPEQESLLAFAFERYFQTSALFGTPTTCLSMVNRLKKIGVAEIACLIDFGVANSDVLASLEVLNGLRMNASQNHAETPPRSQPWQMMLEQHQVSLIHGTADILPPLASYAQTEGSPTRFKLLLISEHQDGDSRRDQPTVEFPVFSATGREQILRALSARTQPPTPERPSAKQAEQSTSMSPRIQRASEPAIRPSPASFLENEATPQKRELVRWLQQIIVTEIARSLHIDPEQVPLDRNFYSLGVSSLKAVEMMEMLAQDLGVPLSPTILFEAPTVSELAKYFARTHSLELNARVRTVPPTLASVQPGNIHLESPGLIPTSAEVRQAATPNYSGNTKVRTGDVAVIGMSCRFPQAPDLQTFWELLRDGKDAITEVPLDHWDWRPFYSSNPDMGDKTYSRWGGFLSDVDKFDPLFFNISPHEARLMDPQQRIFLEVAWETCEHAGYSAESLAEREVGVFVGSSNNTYYHRIVHALTQADHAAGVGNQNAVIANRVSFALNFRGPSILVDTMCSSSLVAVHLAGQSLQQGECELALAGGVNILLSPEYYVAMSRMKAHSPDGRCKAFDHRANGIVFGEGAGAVLLKSLSRALADGDNIYAVITGSAINHGGRTNGLTAPNPQAHAELISRALDRAGVTADAISYLEAHGTGTSLGDPIEIAGLTKAFRQHTNRKQFCGIGSVKTNIGHLEPAAGISGLIKVILSMQHGQLPPTLHFEKANPIIPFEDSPFKVNTELRPWVTQDVRRAAVSSFGIGGSNAHVVLEEAPRAGLRIIQNERPLQILTLSAKSESALRQLAGRYAEHLHKHPEFDVGDICFTANTGRVHFAHRLAASAETAEQLARQLQSVAAGEEARGLQHGQVHTGKAPGIAFLFTGQGAQFVGMGRQLYQTQATFRAALDECDQLLRPHLEQPLLSVLYSEGESANALLNRTAYAQPALFAIEYALMALWRSWGVVPEALLGHSVGEYVAACVAGVFSLEEGLWLIAERGRLMQSLPDGGAMAAVFASEERVREAIAGYPDEVAVAAVNAPDQVVISGGNERIKLLLEQFEGAGVQTRRLPVSHAFHSPLMQPILAEFEQQARQVVFRQPQLPIVSNLTGHVWIDGQKPDAAYWRRHLREPVRFATGLQSLAERGCEIFVELGPTPVLLSMAATVLSGANVHRLPSLRKGQDDWKQMTESFSALHLAGVEVDWKGFDRDYSRRRIALPTYPFERKSYWFQSTGADVYGSSQLRQEVSQQKPEVMSRVAPNNGSDLKKKETRMEEAPHNDRLLVARAEPTRKEGILLVLQPLMAHCLEMDLALVDIHTPFLEMGADSLVLLEAIQTIQTRFGVQLPIRLLFEEHTTLDALATFLEQSLPPVVQEDTALLTNPAAHHGNGASQTTVQSTAKACTPNNFEDLSANVPVRPYQPAPGMEGYAPTPESSLERVMAHQLGTLSQLMAQQLEVLRSTSLARTPPSRLATVEPESLVPQEPSGNGSHPTPALAAPTATFANDDVESIKAAPWVPYQPLNAGRMEELTVCQQEYLSKFIARYVRRTPESKRQTQHYRGVHADLKPALSFRLCTKEIRYPIIGARSQGSHLWDVDGNDYVDFTMGYGLNLFGHNASFIQEAIEEQLKLGMHLGPQTQLAGEVAELISELTGMERVAFCNTGTEAIMAALRLARTATARNKVALFTGSYHGTWDGVLVNPQAADGKVSPIPMVPGIPAEAVKEMLVLNYGSARSLEVLKAHLHELAAVLVEPVQSRKPDLQPREFLHELRRLTEEAGVALIFDEVITGFRVLPGGAQAWFGVQADLATYGKIVGGGLPIGILAGNARFMNPIDGGVWTYGDLSVPGAATTLYTGTFCKHPLAMAASRAVLRHIKEHADEIYPRLNNETTRLAQTLNNYFDSENVPLTVAHFGSLFRLGGSLQLTSQDGMDLLFYNFIYKGIYVWEGRNWFISTAHTDEEIQRMIEVVKESVAELSDGGFLTPPSRPASHRNRLVASGSNGSYPPAAGQDKEMRVPSFVAAQTGNGASAKPSDGISFALTDSQKHLWLLSQMGCETSSAYNQSVILRMSGPVNYDALRSTFQTLINRHEALRTTFSKNGDCQQVWPAMTIAVPLLDFSNERSDKVDSWLQAESCNAFDLSCGPLLRANILKLDEGTHLLVLAVHHIVTDGWSVGVLVKELSSLYSAECEGVSCQLPRPMQFREYLEQQRAEDGTAEVKASEAYWLKQMLNAPSLELPIDYPHPQTQSYEGTRQQLTLDENLAADLIRVSGKLGSTLFMTLLAVFKVLLRQLTGEEDVVVVVPVAGQAVLGGVHLIGDCSNLLALRLQRNGGQFADFLSAVKTAVLDANEHTDYPFTTLMRSLNPRRDPSRWPFFNIDRPPTVPNFLDLEVELVQFPIRYTNFDLGLNIIQIGRQLQLGLDYKSSLFNAETIRGWMRHYEVLLRTIVAQPELSLADLPVLVLPEARTIDRELPGDVKLRRAATYLAPRTEMEELLAMIWAEVLGVERVGVHDNFFESGGHSLLATQIVSRVREVLKVDLPLTPMFAQPTVAGLAACVQQALANGQSLSSPPIERITRGGQLPLSLAQQRLWFIEQLEPGNVAYNILGSVRLIGKLDVPALTRAFSEITRRHESLRTTFATGEDGLAKLVIRPFEPLPLSFTDLRLLPPQEREAEALRTAQADARTPFDLSIGPLIRVCLLQLAEEEHIVVLTMHHIISDGWSVGVLFYEAARLYEAFSAGRDSPLPDLSIQYADYAVWQRKFLQGEVLATQLDYWLKQLTGAPSLVTLPTDRPRLAAPSFRGASETFTLPANLTAALKELSLGEGVTLFMTLLSAFETLLHRYSGQDDMIVGTDVANRNRFEIEGLIGFFVNLLALRTKLTGNPSFRELLGRVRDVTIGAYAHQDVPFEQIVSALRPERHVSKTPLVQVLFVMQNTPMPPIKLPDLTLDLLPFHTDTAEFELIVSVEECPQGLNGAFTYSTDLFDRSTIIRMQKQFRTLLESVLLDPDQPLSALSVLTEEEMGGLSPADFPDADLSRKDLENLVMTLNQEGV